MNKFKNTKKSRKSRKNRKSKRIYGKGNIFGIEIPKENKSPIKKGESFDIEAQLPVTPSNVSSETVSDYEISNINNNYKRLNRSKTMSPTSFDRNRSPTPDINLQLPYDDYFLYGEQQDPNERSYNYNDAKQTTDDRTKYYHPGKFPEDMSEKELNSKKAHEEMNLKFGGKKRRKRKTNRKNKKKRKTRKNIHLG